MLIPTSKCHTSKVFSWYRILRYHDESVVTDLVFDGGPENNNEEMKAYVDKDGVGINPIIALKDTPYSNSVIEAQNKLFKYRYLFRQKYEDIHSL